MAVGGEISAALRPFGDAWSDAWYTTTGSLRTIGAVIVANWYSTSQLVLLVGLGSLSFVLFWAYAVRLSYNAIVECRQARSNEKWSDNDPGGDETTTDAPASAEAEEAASLEYKCLTPRFYEGGYLNQDTDELEDLKGELEQKYNELQATNDGGTTPLLQRAGSESPLKGSSKALTLDERRALMQRWLMQVEGVILQRNHDARTRCCGLWARCFAPQLLTEQGTENPGSCMTKLKKTVKKVTTPIQKFIDDLKIFKWLGKFIPPLIALTMYYVDVWSDLVVLFDFWRNDQLVWAAWSLLFFFLQYVVTAISVQQYLRNAERIFNECAHTPRKPPQHTQSPYGMKNPEP